MLTLLKATNPIAKKEQHCMFCHRKINKGEKYNRSTIVYDRTIYDWTECDKCKFVAYELGMYDNIETDSLEEEDFRDNIGQYVYDNHYDEKIDDISKEWQLSLIETVDKIYEEITNKKNKS